MKNTSVIFRDFEERDIEFVHKSKGNADLFNMAVTESNTFTYENAVSWVQGCMKSDGSYKYWAICTDDDEKRIIGWCGIANIDWQNKSAYFQTIVINDKDYKGGMVVSRTHRFIMQYVFEELKLNRLYSSYLSENEFQNEVSNMLFNSIEGVMKQAIYKNGTYHDLTIAAILKKDYFEHKNNGDFDIEKLQNRMITATKASNFEFEEFLEFIKNSLDDVDTSTLTPQTKFRDLPDWSSLTALILMSKINEQYGVPLSEDDIIYSDTIEEIYNAINSKL